MNTPETFRTQMVEFTSHLAGRALDAELHAWLNQEYGAESHTYRELKRACEDGASAGWLCNREAAGIRYGRIFKPSPDLHGFSVDVVHMCDIAGPHHVHPLGEIDLVLPLDHEARFEDCGAGWLVLPPGSAHRPTVTGGGALVLYLLPDGQIEFTR